MYTPSHFKLEQRSQLHHHIRQHNFGALVVADHQGIEANHLPFFLNAGTDDQPDRLECHVARPNPLWQRLKATPQVLCIFQGPHAYISPSWYPSKAEDGRVVPTWNYLAIHAQGRARVIRDPNWLEQHLNHLTDHQEAGREPPWAVDDTPPEFKRRMLEGAVGIEIEITALTGKLKASQNQSAMNRRAVRRALANDGTVEGAAMAALIPGDEPPD